MILEGDKVITVSAIDENLVKSLRIVNAAETLSLELAPAFLRERGYTASIVAKFHSFRGQQDLYVTDKQIFALKSNIDSVLGEEVEWEIENSFLFKLAKSLQHRFTPKKDAIPLIVETEKAVRVSALETPLLKNLYIANAESPEAYVMLGDVGVPDWLIDRGYMGTLCGRFFSDTERSVHGSQDLHVTRGQMKTLSKAISRHFANSKTP